MAAGKVKLYNYAVVEIDGRHYQLGGLNFPSYIALAGERVEKTLTIAVSSSADIFDVVDDMGDFDFLWIQSDFDLLIEFIVDDNASVGEQAEVRQLKGSGVANRYGIPIILADDLGYANNSAGFAGTADTIERITAKNESSTQAAQVYVFAAT